MRNAAQSLPLLQTACEVWDFLENRAGLDLKRYDIAMDNELRAGLRLGNGDFRRELTRWSISVESLIAWFFKATQPYGVMMVDLLAMFEKAGATETKDNLQVRFDFGADTPKLEFDLKHFRQFVETWRRVEGLYVVNVWNTNTIWKPNNAVRAWGVPTRDPDITRWLAEYDAGRWPTFIPSPPRCGVSELDARLAQIWSLWREVVSESANVGPTRGALKQRWLEEQSRATGDLSGSVEDTSRWSLNLLRWIDSDSWAGSLARGAYHKAETIASAPQAERTAAAKDLIVAIDAAFEACTLGWFKGDVMERHLEEFLQLPVWKRRHELYSAWVATQIREALGGDALRIHTVGEALVFAFSGTHFASRRDLDPALHVWTELRSPLEHPLSKKRRRAIQPDYSLVTDPITDVRASLLVVECKQYLAASSKNFSEALIDYANGRPQADVILVNYGPASQTILTKIDPAIRGRTQLIGEFRPGSLAAIKEFRRAVSAAVTRVYGPDEILGLESQCVGEPQFECAARIKLSWLASPRDLDLYMRIYAEDGVRIVNFSNEGNLDGDPWARLDADVQSGHGEETIDIKRWLVGKYLCAVHQYSKDAPLADCGAEVSFWWAKNRVTFRCPPSGSGEWWTVFSFDPHGNHLEAQNKIVDSPWD